MDIKKHRYELSGETFDFNIKPIAKSKEHFQNWVDVYPFYANVKIVHSYFLLFIRHYCIFMKNVVIF